VLYSEAPEYTPSGNTGGKVSYILLSLLSSTIKPVGELFKQGYSLFIDNFCRFIIRIMRKVGADYKEILAIEKGAKCI
jgi:hypothetical protein